MNVRELSGPAHFGHAMKEPRMEGESMALLRKRLFDLDARAQDAFSGTRHADYERITRAMAWAIECHVTQTRPDGSPYLLHIADVAGSVLDWYGGLDPDVVAAAFLHDSLEDNPDYLATYAAKKRGTPRMTALSGLREFFGDRVADLVFALTNPEFEELILREHGYRRGTPEYDATMIAMYTQHFVDLCCRSPLDASVIKMADFASNALSLENFDGDDSSHEWFVRKYGPCVQFAISHLERHRGADHPIRDAAEKLMPRFVDAWQRHYANPRRTGL